MTRKEEGLALVMQSQANFLCGPNCSKERINIQVHLFQKYGLISLQV